VNGAQVVGDDVGDGDGDPSARARALASAFDRSFAEAAR